MINQVPSAPRATSTSLPVENEMDARMEDEKKGSDSASEIYVAVGLALSFWESFEDVFMGLFADLCFEEEPTAYKTYVDSNRAQRQKMFKTAVSKDKRFLTSDEKDAIAVIVNKANRLATRRNQIAHGHVTETSVQEDGVSKKTGFFLVPALNDRSQPIARNPVNSLTAAEIGAWTDELRMVRGELLDLSATAHARLRNAELAMSETARWNLMIAKAIANGSSAADDWTILQKSKD